MIRHFFTHIFIFFVALSYGQTELITIYDKDCHYCRDLLNVIYQDTEVKKALAAYQVKLYEMNSSEGINFIEQYRIRSLPAQIVLKDGELENSLIGYVDAKKQTRFLDDPKLYWLEDFENVCEELEELSDIDEDKVEKVRKEILTTLGKSQGIRMFSGEMIDVFNENLNYFRCEKSSNVKVKNEKSLFKFAIDLERYDFLADLVHKMACGEGIDMKKLNINHYDIIDGEKETLLDYIDFILENPKPVSLYNLDSLHKIKKDLTLCGAKKGVEL